MKTIRQKTSVILEGLAEREGFEPPVRFPVHLISRDQRKRDRSISKHKFTEENNYPPTLVSAHCCESLLAVPSQFIHSDFSASAEQIDSISSAPL